MSPKRDFAELEARRLAGARMLKRKVSQAEVARRLGVSRQTASDWARQLAQANGAIGKLKAKPLGRPQHLDQWQCQALRHWLIGGAQAAGFPTDLWTLKRVRLLVEREFGIGYSKAGAWDLLRRLDFTPQKPERRARQRDEDGIAQWKRKTWPALKKRRDAKDARLSSSTNPA
jgi:transposase